MPPLGCNQISPAKQGVTKRCDEALETRNARMPECSMDGMLSESRGGKTQSPNASAGAANHYQDIIYYVALPW